MGVTDLRQTTTGDQPGDARPPSWSRRPLVARVLLGGWGFVDGIVLHQILRSHHMLTATGDHPADSVAGLESNTLTDGLFHAATWLFVVAGIVVLRRAWAAATRADRRGTARRCAREVGELQPREGLPSSRGAVLPILRGACPHLSHVQSATWLLQGTTWCPVGRIWPGSSVAGSFGTQRSGVQISPTRLQLRRHFGAA